MMFMSTGKVSSSLEEMRFMLFFSSAFFAVNDTPIRHGRCFASASHLFRNRVYFTSIDAVASIACG